MAKDVKLYLEDILLSIAAIESHLAGIIYFSQYENNLKVSDAVERRISIIGEAVFKADKLDKSLFISNKKNGYWTKAYHYSRL